MDNRAEKLMDKQKKPKKALPKPEIALGGATKTDNDNLNDGRDLMIVYAMGLDMDVDNPEKQVDPQNQWVDQSQPEQYAPVTFETGSSQTDIDKAEKELQNVCT